MDRGCIQSISLTSVGSCSQVGGGPTALVTALVLAQHGTPVRVIEKELGLQAGERGPGIQPRSLELLQFAGILDDYLKIARPVPQVRIFKDGVPEPVIASLSQEMDPTPARPFTEMRMLGQSRFVALLADILKTYGVYIETGTALRSFEQDEAGVTVHILKHGDDGEQVQDTFRVGWIVGADGAKGATRKLLNLSFKGEDLHGRWLVCDVELEKPWTEADAYFSSWSDSNGVMWMIRPTAYDTPRLGQLLVAGEQVNAEHLTTHPEDIVKGVNDVIPLPSVKVSKVLWVSAQYRPSSRMVEKFSEGRVFVAGDAAHIHPPSGGQGLNSGLQDAVNIGWKLALVSGGHASPSLLSSYDDERHPVIRTMLQLTGGLYKTTREEKDAKKGFNRSTNFYMLDINYRWSGIVMDDRVDPNSPEKKDTSRAYTGNEDGVHAGERAPEAPELEVIRASAAASLEGQGPTSIFKLFKLTKHTALIFVKQNADSSIIAAFLQALASFPPGTVQTAVVISPSVTDEQKATFATLTEGADVVLLDKAGHAFREYGVGDDSSQALVLVRPDGYVGAYVYGTEGLKTYTEALFGGAPVVAKSS
ncbi:hypothetical protein PUNSTDRAFT_92169 [Punctularia strigosozonata HHB-11173 SS5]|uniref:FAD-binding domain-containing protein n=1 Tax=Punctularia strigosozonata (strain HHB-11173) TaxID=741275 RepID=R7S5L7_PUNST|nr:uncharacterized protein PUNSTDRAFT_92169 [Punctularia strigosozonata HHB-11173 SS5]EIN05287.1 hypothetical protein PUNSTDRAFT_92169 [Punctularia strigosozonata HHB-11173 SS5]